MAARVGGLVKGRALAAWPSIRDDMVHAGATWLDEPLVDCEPPHRLWDVRSRSTA